MDFDPPLTDGRCRFFNGWEVSKPFSAPTDGNIGAKLAASLPTVDALNASRTIPANAQIEHILLMCCFAKIVFSVIRTVLRILMIEITDWVLSVNHFPNNAMSKIILSVQVDDCISSNIVRLSKFSGLARSPRNFVDQPTCFWIMQEGRFEH